MVFACVCVYASVLVCVRRPEGGDMWLCVVVRSNMCVGNYMVLD